MSNIVKDYQIEKRVRDWVLSASFSLAECGIVHRIITHCTQHDGMYDLLGFLTGQPPS